MDPLEIEKLAARTLDALEQGEHLRALALADQLVEADPDSGLFRCWRAYALFDGGQTAEACQEARRVTELAEDLHEAHFVLAVSSALLGRLDDAQQAFEKAAELSDGDPSVLAEYANFMAVAREPRRAEEAAVRAVRAAADNAECWAALGLAQLRLGSRAEAESSLKRALELDPHNPRAQAYVGKFLYDTGREKEAEAMAKLMQDTPALRDVAEQLAGAVRARRTATAMMARKEFREAAPGARRRGWKSRVGWALLCAAAAAVIISAFAFFGWVAGALACVTIGLFVLLRRI